MARWLSVPSKKMTPAALIGERQNHDSAPGLCSTGVNVEHSIRPRVTPDRITRGFAGSTVGLPAVYRQRGFHVYTSAKLALGTFMVFALFLIVRTQLNPVINVGRSINRASS